MMVDFGGFRGRFALGFDTACERLMQRSVHKRHGATRLLLAELGVDKVAVKPVIVEYSVAVV